METSNQFIFINFILEQTESSRIHEGLLAIRERRDVRVRKCKMAKTISTRGSLSTSLIVKRQLGIVKRETVWD